VTALPAWAVVKPGRAAHIERVAALLNAWAAELGLDPAEADRWQRAAVLHDALKDAGPDVLARYTPQAGWHPKLWHGPAAAAAAARHGESDPGVLSAVHYHSVGFAGWDGVGRALFLADYLEPGRVHDTERSAAWAARLPRELEPVLREVASRRIGLLMAAGQPLMRETWEFWNRLVGVA
jgi:2-amino-4-hydroxy-6-hydroxymethyldihydropteridine diphosphokinase